jgi:hypothetical protein
MRIAIITLVGIVSAAWISVDAATPSPAPQFREVAAYQPIAEGCGYGWHWTNGYTASGGDWVAGRCQPN